MINNNKKSVLDIMLEEIELPSSAYEKADNRYQDIGDWFGRKDSSCVHLSPHIFSQGSFRLGTANKPDKGDEYDLDMACKLCHGIEKNTTTQKQLKKIIGDELELYRQEKGIKEALSEKQRCWRIEYADGLRFHLDIVPCIPESSLRKETLKKRMVESSMMDDVLAGDVSQLAVSITDNEDIGYDLITDNWRISNPEGYARWFEGRMRIASQFLSERALVLKANVDDLPYYQWQTPLQGAIKLLKRHRDIMFKDNEDAKPISVIITTLAAKAYNGEGDVESALRNILKKMNEFVNDSVPHVPNPVNPDEDFADKWYSEEHSHLKLKENFLRWQIQAEAHFATLCSQENSQLIMEAAETGLDVHIKKDALDEILGIKTESVFPTVNIQSSNPRPWHKK